MSRPRAGTTVLELVVALVVTGAVAAAGAAAFRQAIDRRGQLLTSSTSTERASALRAMLREWLSAGTLVWPSGPSSLSFTTTAPTPIGVAGAPVRLYIDDDPATPEQGICLETRATASTVAVRRELDAGITYMLVEYLDADTRQWVLGADASAGRPLAVRLTFPPSAPNGEPSAATDRLLALPLTVVFPVAGEPLPARPSTDAPMEPR